MIMNKLNSPLPSTNRPLQSSDQRTPTNPWSTDPSNFSTNGRHPPLDQQTPPTCTTFDNTTYLLFHFSCVYPYQFWMNWSDNSIFWCLASLITVSPLLFYIQYFIVRSHTTTVNTTSNSYIQALAHHICIMYKTMWRCHYTCNWSIMCSPSFHKVFHYPLKCVESVWRCHYTCNWSIMCSPTFYKYFDTWLILWEFLLFV